MINLSPTNQIFVYTIPIDGRKGINALIALARYELEKDPYSGAFFVFLNKRKNSVKILCYDGTGIWLHMKRLSRGIFKYWPSSDKNENLQYKATQLQVLLFNGDPQGLKLQPDWKRVA
jgi:transposase